MQRFLKIHDNLAPVFKGQRDHAANALIVDIRVVAVVEPIAGGFNAAQQAFRTVHEFKVGHYNLPMLKVHQILVTTIVLAAGAVVLNGCGQKGPLVLPPPKTASTAPKSPAASVIPGAPSPAATPSQ